MRNIKTALATLVFGILLAIPVGVSAQTADSDELVNQPLNCIIDEETQQTPETIEGCNGQEPLNTEEPIVPEEPIDDGRPDKGEVSSETVAGYEETPPQVLSATTETVATTATLAETGYSQVLSIVVALALITTAITLALATRDNQQPSMRQ